MQRSFLENAFIVIQLAGVRSTPLERRLRLCFIHDFDVFSSSPKFLVQSYVVKPSTLKFESFGIVSASLSVKASLSRLQTDSEIMVLAKPGNFHVVNASEDESWITVGEWMPRNGYRGDVLLARVRWSNPNRLPLW